MKLNLGDMYLPNLFIRAGYDTRSIFQRIAADFNSEFSFLLDWYSYQS